MKNRSYSKSIAIAINNFLTDVEEIRALLDEGFDGDRDAMIAQLATRFGIDESELCTDVKPAESKNAETNSNKRSRLFLPHPLGLTSIVTLQ